MLREPNEENISSTTPLLKMDFSRFPSVAPMPFPVMCCAFVP
jgi:hypothetical protein